MNPSKHPTRLTARLPTLMLLTAMQLLVGSQIKWMESALETAALKDLTNLYSKLNGDIAWMNGALYLVL